MLHCIICIICSVHPGSFDLLKMLPAELANRCAQVLVGGRWRTSHGAWHGTRCGRIA